MQIAQVIPKVRTQNKGIFDYLVPAEILADIRIGSLVLVPFHGREVESIIIDFKKYSGIEKIKTITKIIDPTPVIDETHAKVAHWIADYYIEPIGKVIFENIPPPAARAIKKQQPYYLKPSEDNIKKSKKFLIVGDFSKRLKFYQKAIAKTLASKKEVLILIPDLSHFSYFKKLDLSFNFYHSGLSKTERWILFDLIRKGKTPVVIGSQSALFAPLANLGLIIIDQEENETYKNYRSPRFDTLNVAQKLAEISGANLVIGSLTPRVETYWRAKKYSYAILEQKNEIKTITIVDTNNEKSYLSISLENSINQALKSHKKVLLILNRKGEGIKFSCHDCNWTAFCPDCKLPLVPTGDQAVCFHCEKSFTQETVCPKCGSAQLKPFGLSIGFVHTQLKKIFENQKIIKIEKESPLIGKDWDIAICTNFALKYNFSNIGLVGILDIDTSMNLPDFNTAQKIFQTHLKFLRLGDKGIIQTRVPENFLVKNLATLNYQKFFESEIETRYKLGFPPFTKIIKIEYRHEDLTACKQESMKIFNGLKVFEKDILLLTKPHPPFYQKDKKKFRYQIVLKIQNNIPIDLRKFLRGLPKGWIIDVDPISLL